MSDRAIEAPAAASGRSRRWSLAALGIRREEALLAALLAVSVLLCLASGTGFAFGRVFERYLRTFALYVAAVFVVTRLTSLLRERWRPAGRAGRRVKRWLGGDPRDGAGLAATDLELVRGLALLFVTLTVYTNVKVRIPFINAAVGDGFFLELDRLFPGEGLIRWVEQAVAARSWATGLLDRVYFHDYLWMVVLVLIFCVRHDRLRLRWTFISVCLVYILGILLTAAYPSYGPFFFEHDRFAWLQGTMTALAQRNLAMSLIYSQQAAAAGDPIATEAFLGVAAFPSLHVGHMVILVVVGWRPVKLYALFVAAIAFLTTLATIAFGWHYLVDATGGALLAAGVTLGIRPLVFAPGQRSAPAGEPGTG